MPRLRVIVGQGTAAEVYRSTQATGDGYETVVIGPRGLWAALPQGHRMGQTPELLHLPGQRVPAHTTADGATPHGMTRFLDVNIYQQGLIALSQRSDNRSAVRRVSGGIALDQLTVTKITEHQQGGQLIVETSHPGVRFLADQVVLATGIGPQRGPITAANTTGTAAAGLGYRQIVEGVQYLNAGPPYGKITAVYGGSATSAWVAAEAMQRSDKLIWFTRPGGSEFTGCSLPGNRNHMILHNTRDIRRLCSLDHVTYMNEVRRGGRLLRRAMVKLSLRDAGGAVNHCLVDQLVYSIGADPLGEGSMLRILSDGIKARLQPVIDINRVISSGNGVIAVGTPSRNVLIIGAGIFNLGNYGVSSRNAAMQSLPTASQVPDGIAMIVATESALNNFAPFEQDNLGNVTEANLNINLADRNQLAIYLALFYPDLGPAAANEIVVRVISLRSSGTVGHQFGITEAELQTIINQYIH